MHDLVRQCTSICFLCVFSPLFSPNFYYNLAIAVPCTSVCVYVYQSRGKITFATWRSNTNNPFIITREAIPQHPKLLRQDNNVNVFSLHKTSCGFAFLSAADLKGVDWVICAFLSVQKPCNYIMGVSLLLFVSCLESMGFLLGCVLRLYTVGSLSPYWVVLVCWGSI